MTNEPKQSERIPQVVLAGLVVVSIAFTLLDLTYERHPHVKFESWFNFYGFFAGLTTVGFVLVAAMVRNAIGRQEDYYDG